MSARSRAVVKAVLGPTNTGKTHLAIERMLGHASGMIGLPLRLLAREVYDRVVAAKGEAAAALDHRRRKDRARERALFRLHGRGHAARLEDRVPGRRRNPGRARSRPRPRLHRSHAARARLRRDHAAGLGHDAPDGAQAAAGRGDHAPRADVDAGLCRPAQDHQAAEALGRGRVLGRGSLRHRRTAAPPSRRRGGGDGRAFARARATRRWRSIRAAKWISWSPPTPSAWASTWMSTMSPSPRGASSTAIAGAICAPTRSPRSPAAPGASPATAQFGETGECAPFDEEIDRARRKPRVRADRSGAMAQREL